MLVAESGVDAAILRAISRHSSLRTCVASDFDAAVEPQFAAQSEWPHGTLQADAPPEAHLAQPVAHRLSDTLARQELSLRAASTATGASIRALFNILHGKTWSDLPTLARIERGLGIDLWGNEHRR